MKRLLAGVFTALVLLFLIAGGISAEEPALKLVRIQPFTVDFQISQYNPSGASKTKYYIYRQEGFEIDISTASLISQLTLPSKVTFDWSNTDLDSFPIEKGITYTYIVKAEALDKSNNIISDFTTNSVIVSVPKPNVSIRLLDKDGEALANIPIEIIGNGGYNEAGFSNGLGYVSGFTLDDGQYEVIVRSGDTQEIIKKGVLVISNGLPTTEQVELEIVETNDSAKNRPGSSSGATNTNTQSTNQYKKYVINLMIGKNQALVNNEAIQLDSPVYVKNNRTMVPIRFIAEILGSDVSWDRTTSTVNFEFNGKIIILKINEPFALINEQIVGLDVAAEIHNGRTMVPIRFVAENFGFNVGWESQTRTVTLSNP